MLRSPLTSTNVLQNIVSCLDVHLVAVVADHGAPRAALVRVPGGGEEDVDRAQEDTTVGQGEDAARRVCQEALKLTQNYQLC